MTTEPANSAAHRITGPHPAGDLAVYLVHGLDRCDAHQFDTLADANPEAGAQPTEPHLTPGSVSAWLQEAISSELLEQQHIAPASGSSPGVPATSMQHTSAAWTRSRGCFSTRTEYQIDATPF